MYQARSLIGSDASGLSDPFARVICGEYTKVTQVIDETLSPTWDELLVFDEILVYGRREDIKANPPVVIVEIYDQDKVGKAEFLGRAIGKPTVTLGEDNYVQPNLEWFQIHRGLDDAGDLLAAFQFFEVNSLNFISVTPVKLKKNNISQLGDSEHVSDLPPLPEPKDGPDTGPILPVPKGIRPTLAKYR